ncbi:MAG TPA: hypothetical protein VKU02_12770, partial [Gemmataceae bacterium]|nr:hypothetical protein [Gemmataceae bacterium]
QGNASIRTGDGIALDVAQSSVGGLLDISLGGGGVNAFESLTLQDVTSADLSIGLRSNAGDIADVNLTNVTVTDTAPATFAFRLADVGGSGGMDQVTMQNVQVADGIQVVLSSGGSSVLSATNVTCLFSSLDLGPDGVFQDGGGNSGL